MRNFWIELEVDGRKTKVKTGPRRKDGGFHLNVYQRDKGSSSLVALISGLALEDRDELVLTVTVKGHKRTMVHKTRR